MTVPGGQPHRLIGPAMPAFDQDLGALGGIGLAGLAADLGDLGDRRQRLAAEAQRPHPVQVLDLGELARRVGLEGQQQVVRSHAQPLSAIRTRSLPPRSTVTSTRVAPASIAFSSSSFTTLAGRSTTSPAAIWFTTDGGN